MSITSLQRCSRRILQPQSAGRPTLFFQLLYIYIERERKRDRQTDRDRNKRNQTNWNITFKSFISLLF